MQGRLRSERRSGHQVCRPAADLTHSGGGCDPDFFRYHRLRPRHRASVEWSVRI